MVADEVRKLAERSQVAAQEIGQLAGSSVKLAEQAGSDGDEQQRQQADGCEPSAAGRSGMGGHPTGTQRVTRRIQTARQIFSVLVPPGVPMGSPTVMA